MRTLEKLKELEQKAIREAEKAAQDVLNKYSLEMSSIVKKSLNQGEEILQGNGMAYKYDSDGNEIAKGRAWGLRG